MVDSGDESGRAVKREIIPSPLHQDQKPIPESDEIHQVDDEPHHPGDEAAEMYFAEVGHGGGPADGGHVAKVAVAKPWQGPGAKPCVDQPRHELALLNRDRSHARQWPTALMRVTGHVAEYEDLWVAG